MKEKSFEKKQELLEAALNEFSSKKYEDASLNSIIKSAGISKGTFYYHFKDKQELYIYLLESSSKVKWEFINKNIKSSSTEEKGDIFATFRLQARIGAEFASIHPKYHNLSRMFVKEKGNEIYDTAKNVLIEDDINPLNEIIENAVKKGDFRNDLPGEFIIKIISHLFTHFEDVFNSEDDMELGNIIKNLDYYVDFMKNGLYNKITREDI
ncbi:TetR/AcrR family transcriptional regulator [Sedimentibacter hydroxybenzoicus DSM 7310]|uniref:TetR/AcrR family transcriptional regulator n=1 Tax=Sedimentibacter hydroxybenzoicus DSM 7310 TaxID=1123245 RepID=A0A974GXL0_SEDHY|nr:TetR/AcrR family transcriptional regulator [Sedimentibacter hydroxybenzoicus]NYB75175.1 TetR/AcrR family transcriptional regulator [Sedimentibacter hydroxybenzoicus DSM 7310]